MLSGALWMLGLLTIAPVQEAEDTGSHTYSIPLTRLAQARLDEALQHIEGQRWIEAIDQLELLLAEHPGDVLPGVLDFGTTRSQQPVFVSASARARELLRTLPPEPLARYRARQEALARGALERAQSQRDALALGELARVHPWTDTATRALLSLGDLELEAGREPQALQAWNRALENDPALLGTLSAGRRLLLEELRAPARHAGLRSTEALGSFLPCLRAESDLSAPGKEASQWPEAYRLGEIVSGRVPSSDALQLTRSGDTLFVALPRRLIALHAFSGARLWESEEPPGWSRLSNRAREELSLAVHDETAQYAAAAGERIVVAAQQLPFALNERQTFGQLEILKPMPERRLAAFEIASGKPLWNHRPPAGWDGTGGDFLQRMNICGPPVIVGNRIYAPYARIEGRIDLHVACIELETGKLCWSRSLISGQRELNMFGRQSSEFCAPPLVVENGRVFALTALGTIAALDALSGELLWQTAYEQIVIERNYSRMEAQPLVNVWRQSPPWMVGSLLLATPYDSPDLVAIDTRSGALVWSLPYSFFMSQGAARYRGQELLFAGANEDKVLVMGTKLVALANPAGLRAGAPRKLAWQYEHEDLSNPTALGRPVLTRESVTLPLLDARVELELRSGRELSSVPWDSTGNILLGRGELFRVTRGSVQGYFEWTRMIARARTEADREPKNREKVLLVARLLASSAGSALEAGDTLRAREELGEADRRLTEALDPSSMAFEERELAWRVLWLSAQAQRALADNKAALEFLRRARAQAAGPAQRLEGLLAEYQLENEVGRQALLQDFEAHGDGLVLLCVPVGDSDPLHFVPGVGEGVRELPVRLWVGTERARAARTARRVDAELSALQPLVRDWSQTELPGIEGERRAGALARARILQLCASAAPEQLAAYAARAAAELDRALSLNDEATLLQMENWWPGTAAAVRASDLRLERAAQSGDPARLLATLVARLEAPLELSRANPRDLALWKRAAEGLASSGNQEFAAVLLQSLARVGSDAELERRAQQLLPVEALAEANFAADPPRAWALDAASQFLGTRSVRGERLWLVALVDPQTRQWKVTGWSAKDPSQPVWASTVPEEMGQALGAADWRTQARLAGERVLLAASNQVLALDAGTGEISWRAFLPSGEASLALSAGSGLAFVLARSEAGENRVLAYDARGGTLLWTRASTVHGARALPLVAEDRLCFLPQMGAIEIEVADLYTGRRIGTLTLAAGAQARVESDAWVEGQRLLVPWIEHASLSRIECHDVRTLARLWDLDLSGSGEERRQLSTVLQHGGRTWLYLRPIGTNAATRSPQLIELSTAIGALAPLSHVRLSFEDRLLGSRQWRRRELPSPELFMLSRRPQNPQEARVRCIDLAKGERWVTTLSVPWKEIGGGQTPLPAISSECVLLAYAPGRSANRSGEIGTQLVFLDRASGLMRADKRALPSASFGDSDSVEFVPMGNSLFVRGERRLELWQ
jgi:outer membrane protein assembly factor BamB